MRRQSVAIIGVVAAAMAVGVSPSASADQNGYNPDYTYVRTAGNVQCVISADRAACERAAVEGFPAAPADASGGHWPVASVAADGKFSWDEANIGAPTGQEMVLINGQPYHFHGWTLLLTTEGTRLTKVGNTHGMNVSIDGVNVTPY